MIEHRRLPGQDRPVPVSLIVICNKCGNREIGWATLDDGAARLFTYSRSLTAREHDERSWNLPVPHPPPPLVEREPRFRRADVRKPMVDEAIYETTITGAGKVLMECPKHGVAGLVRVDPAALDPTRTVRVRPTKTG